MNFENSRKKVVLQTEVLFEKQLEEVFLLGRAFDKMTVGS